ncbi:MAG: peptidoglycan-binding domain-containing protein [Dichotomicrobium sp.]
MTPFSARLIFLGFLALAGAITTNALYFQEPLETKSGVTGSVAETEEKAARTLREKAETPAETGETNDRQPAGRSAKADRGVPPEDANRSSAARQTAARQPQAETAAPRVAPARATSEEVIRAIQRELAYRNYAIDRRDGKLDVATRLAILNYQYDADMPLTGRPSEGVLENILFGPFQAAPDDRRVARIEADGALVARVQTLLSRLGFANLPRSGRLGADTRRALREFAAFRDLEPDGRLTPRLLLELADVTDEPLLQRSTGSAGDVN